MRKEGTGVEKSDYSLQERTRTKTRETLRTDLEEELQKDSLERKSSGGEKRENRVKRV